MKWELMHDAEGEISDYWYLAVRVAKDDEIAHLMVDCQTSPKWRFRLSFNEKPGDGEWQSDGFKSREQAQQAALTALADILDALVRRLRKAVKESRRHTNRDARK